MQILATQTKAPAITTGVGAAPGSANQMGGFFDSFRMDDTLTENDKKLVGWDPSSRKINSAAIALAGYRHSGALSSEVTPDFVEAIKKSIAKTGGYPVNPASLMTKASQSSPLSPGTTAALFALLDQGREGASAQAAQEA